jgi:SAM-dependent methyltransferase
MFRLMRNDETRASDKTYSNSGDERLVGHFSRFLPCGRLCLDVGCGAGGNAAMLSRNGWIVDGITISESEARLAGSVCREVTIHDLERGLPGTIKPESYDVILASHVLEHVFYPQRLLRDCWQALKPSGGIIVVLPNLLFWRNRLKMALGRFEYQDVGIMDYTHCRWYTFRSARALLEGHHFEVIESVADGQILSGNGLPDILEKGLLRVDQMFRRFTPGLVAFQMYLVGRRGRPNTTVLNPGG